MLLLFFRPHVYGPVTTEDAWLEEDEFLAATAPDIYLTATT